VEGCDGRHDHSIGDGAPGMPVAKGGVGTEAANGINGSVRGSGTRRTAALTPNDANDAVEDHHVKPTCEQRCRKRLDGRGAIDSAGARSTQVTVAQP